MRNLAQRSATAAREIKVLITDSVNRVKVGSELVNNTGEALEQIIDTVKQVLDQVAEITRAGREHADNIDMVNRTVTDMDVMTQQNSALVEEAAAASKLMKQQTANLQHLMNFFKVESYSQSAESTRVNSVEIQHLKNRPSENLYQEIEMRGESVSRVKSNVN